MKKILIDKNGVVYTIGNFDIELLFDSIVTKFYDRFEFISKNSDAMNYKIIRIDKLPNEAKNFKKGKLIYKNKKFSFNPNWKDNN